MTVGKYNLKSVVSAARAALFFGFINEYNRAFERLFVFAERINALDLLTENPFLGYSEEELQSLKQREHQLRERIMEYLALRRDHLARHDSTDRLVILEFATEEVKRELDEVKSLIDARYTVAMQ